MTEFASLLPRYKTALATLTALGYPIPPTGRLAHYRDRLEAVVAAADVGFLRVRENEAIDLSLVMREIDEIVIIADHLPKTLDNELRERIRLLNKGLRAADDETHSPSREAQYELSLWATSRNGGVTATLGRPDLRIDTPMGPLFIEAKRPGARERVDERIRDAVKQLEEVKGARVIAISADGFAVPKRHIVTTERSEDFGDAAGDIVNDAADEFRETIERRCAGRGICGVLFTVRIGGVSRSDGLSATYGATHLVRVLDASPHDLAMARWWMSRNVI